MEKESLHINLFYKVSLRKRSIDNLQSGLYVFKTNCCADAKKISRKKKKPCQNFFICIFDGITYYYLRCSYVMKINQGTTHSPLLDIEG